VYGNDTVYYNYNRFYHDSAGIHYALTALGGSDGAIRWTHDSYGLFAQALARDDVLFATASACNRAQFTCTIYIEALRDADGSAVWKRILPPINGTLRLAAWIEVA
jgi:hypothetical protein